MGTQINLDSLKIKTLKHTLTHLAFSSHVCL